MLCGAPQRRRRGWILITALLKERFFVVELAHIQFFGIAGLDMLLAAQQTENNFHAESHCVYSSQKLGTRAVASASTVTANGIPCVSQLVTRTFPLGQQHRGGGSQRQAEPTGAGDECRNDQRLHRWIWASFPSNTK